MATAANDLALTLFNAGDSPSYREYSPPGDLANDVECFWTSRSAAAGTVGSAQPQRVLPDGCIDIIFDLTAGSAQIVGTMTRAILVPADGHQLLAVRFQPGAARQYIGIPLHEITDAAPALREFWSDENLLAEQLAENGNSSVRQALSLCARFVREHRRAPKENDNSTAALLRSIIRQLRAKPGSASVTALACGYSLSRQHLARLFKQQLGISPKHFQRVMRMQYVVDLVWQPPGIAPRRSHNWADIALRCGYFDQAHLISDFKDLCGVTPAAYFSG